MTKAWWFSSGKTLPHGDGRRVKLGRTHKVKGKISPCRNGLHASVKPLEALGYATGAIIWRVEMGGVIVPHGNDKLCASERTYISGGIDASDTLRHFARLCALDVIDLWTAPEIVIRYLKTGDESIRGAARDAAQGAARAAAWGAAQGTAQGAARDAAWGAARDAAWAAARDPVRAAAIEQLEPNVWDAAQGAARAAAWDAARAAARDAAQGTAQGAAYAAAWDAAWGAQNKRLVRMLNDLIKES